MGVGDSGSAMTGGWSQGVCKSNLKPVAARELARECEVPGDAHGELFGSCVGAATISRPLQLQRSRSMRHLMPIVTSTSRLCVRQLLAIWMRSRPPTKMRGPLRVRPPWRESNQHRVLRRKRAQPAHRRETGIPEAGRCPSSGHVASTTRSQTVMNTS
jgi:hypothetical protein